MLASSLAFCFLEVLGVTAVKFRFTLKFLSGLGECCVSGYQWSTLAGRHDVEVSQSLEVYCRIVTFSCRQEEWDAKGQSTSVHFMIQGKFFGYD